MSKRQCREAVSRHAGTAIVPFFETSGDIAHKTYKKLNTMGKILLESKKNVAVVNCPVCGTIYFIPQKDVLITIGEMQVPKEHRMELVVRCPHCHNFNDYSKAEWYEQSEVDDVVAQRKAMLEKAGF